MRTDSNGSCNNLHFHDGSTCHGRPTLEDCTADAIRNGYTGKVLERYDVYVDGAAVKCYSMVVSSFSHWEKHGKFVAELKIVSVPIF